jgi:hypothetical protein
MTKKSKKIYTIQEGDKLVLNLISKSQSRFPKATILRHEKFYLFLVIFFFGLLFRYQLFSKELVDCPFLYASIIQGSLKALISIYQRKMLSRSSSIRSICCVPIWSTIFQFFKKFYGYSFYSTICYYSNNSLLIKRAAMKIISGQAAFLSLSLLLYLAMMFLT